MAGVGIGVDVGVGVGVDLGVGVGVAIGAGVGVYVGVDVGVDDGVGVGVLASIVPRFQVFRHLTTHTIIRLYDYTNYKSEARSSKECA